jgi:hypothetical protein
MSAKWLRRESFAGEDLWANRPPAEALINDLDEFFPNLDLDARKPYRRYSEDVGSGTIQPLPSCPRTNFVRGRNDWLTLPNCPSFDMCPTCFQSVIAPTDFRYQFIPAPRRPLETEVLCDFGSSPWYRIAWLLTQKERTKDLKLFYQLATVAATVQPCLGEDPAVREWHSILDPKTGVTVPNFEVCKSCVKSIEALLPAVGGIFVNSLGLGPISRICSLRFASSRFVQYFDAFEVMADRVGYEGGPSDATDLLRVLRRLSLIDECQRDTELSGKRWHIITQLPEFTVCQDCFNDVVSPLLEERRAIPMMFNPTLQHIPTASCQLYSKKMRAVFKLAADAVDYKLLACKARERKTFEANIAKLRRESNTDSFVLQNELKKLKEEWSKW